MILSIDYGRKHIGLALSDEMEILATPLPPLRVKDQSTAHRKVRQLVEQFKVNKILLGLPENIPDRTKPIAVEIQEFGANLANKLEVEVAYWDENMTSKLAKLVHNKQGEHSEAARMILQEYLDFSRTGI